MKIDSEAIPEQDFQFFTEYMTRRAYKSVSLRVIRGHRAASLRYRLCAPRGSKSQLFNENHICFD